MSYAAKSSAVFHGAYIRDLQITQSHDSVLTVDMSLLAGDSGVAEYFMRLMRGDLPPNGTMGLHLIEDEFTCAFCNSPNPIKSRHCSQCGAPRGFILGR